MWKWVLRAFVLAVIGGGGYVAYDYYRAGLHTRPTIPPGSFSISFKSGFRAILVDVPNERAFRRYFGIPAEVPFYLEDAWSYCRPPTEEEMTDAVAVMEARGNPGERFEALCKIEVDEDTVIRGFITSVPRL